MTTIDEFNELLEDDWSAKTRMKEFLAAVDLVGWMERRGLQDLSPWDCDKGFLKLSAYRLISHCHDNGHSTVIRTLAAGEWTFPAV